MRYFFRAKSDYIQKNPGDEEEGVQQIIESNPDNKNTVERAGRNIVYRNYCYQEKKKKITPEKDSSVFLIAYYKIFEGVQLL